MLYAQIAIYLALLIYLAHKNFKAAVEILILFLPSYFIRFNVGPLPTSLLEVTFGGLFLVWLIQYARVDWLEIKKFGRENKYFSWAAILFLVFSVVGILVSPETIKALGIWRAYFLEPFLFGLMLVGRRKEIAKDDLIWFLSLSTISISALAIIQKLTGQFYSPTLRTQDLIDLHGRVTSFFTTPNAVGLYLAPIIPLMVYGLKNTHKKRKYFAVLLLAIIAIFLSFSEGSWVALLAGGLAGIFLLGYKKTAGMIVVVGILSILIFAPLRQNVLLQNRSGHNRLVIWEYTWNYLNKNPKNFVFGAGLRQWFDRVQKPVNDFKKIEPLIYPHNIFLNFWSEVGMLAMLAFVALYSCGIYCAFKIYKKEKFFGIMLLAALVVFLIHGLVDVPYFKNDLSFLWWIILSIIVI
ncbi:MAG: hypothetical protein ACD_72C00527G0003 [uncultured bacterium]|nr:MAG: hypothetical protein ACD_72C00527G0003 [uncultured bacterium]